MITNESNLPQEIEPQEIGAAEVCPPSDAHAQRERTGKIARLPLAVRTELNERMRNGEGRADLAAWLNSLPEVQQVMKDHFAGVEVLEINISRWRQGGYQDWLAEERTQEGVAKLNRRADALKGSTLNDLTHNMALVTVARLAVELGRIESMEDDEARFKSLRDIVWAVIFMQRNAAEAERMKQEERRKAGYRLPEKELEKQFWLWAAEPEHKESIHRRLFMSKEEKQAAIDHILADNSSYWEADEAYIKSIGGTLGGERPEQLRKMAEEARAKWLEGLQQEAPPAAAPGPKLEPPSPWSLSHKIKPAAG